MSEKPNPYLPGARRMAFGLVRSAAARIREHGADDVPASRKLGWAFRLADYHGFADALEARLQHELEGV